MRESVSELKVYKTSLYYIPLALQCVYGCSDERDENRDGMDGSEALEEGRKWRMLGILYADALVLFS